MSLKQDLPNIFEFFDMESNEKEKYFHSALDDAMKFSKKIQEAYKSGTEEQREEIDTLLSDMRERISKETENLCKTIGISEEELVAYTENPDNFSPEEWNILEDARKKIHKSQNEFSFVKKGHKSSTKGKRKAVKKKEWLHS